MRSWILTVAILLFVTGCGSTSNSGGAGSETLVNVAENDPEIKAAQDRAQATLDEGLKYLGDSTMPLMIKVALPTKTGGIEHIWVSDVERSGTSFKGRIANDPVNLANLKFGDEVSFVREGISDWMVSKPDGSYLGGYTVEVLLKRQGK